MGTDVHFVVEEHDEKYGWVGVVATDSKFRSFHKPLGTDKIELLRSRDYQFFALISNPRGGGQPALGVPGDASDMTRMYVDYWGGDGHSHSYCSLQEFVERKVRLTHTPAQLAAMKLNNRDPVLEYLGIDDYDAKVLGPLYNYRVIFWFDN